MEKDLALAALAHDLNNVLQTVAQVADLLPAGCAEESSLLIASVERGRSILDSIQEAPTPVALRLVSQRAAKGIERLRVVIEVDEEIRFEGKPLAFERALLNLLWNSARAGATEVRITAARQREACVIDIADNGPGIDEAHLERIFESGFSTTASTGLGLKIVQSIVHGHGGSITVVNRGGACFQIRIPA